jgi:hypothetical protein
LRIRAGQTGKPLVNPLWTSLLGRDFVAANRPVWASDFKEQPLTIRNATVGVDLSVGIDNLVAQRILSFDPNTFRDERIEQLPVVRIDPGISIDPELFNGGLPQGKLHRIPPFIDGTPQGSVRIEFAGNKRPVIVPSAQKRIDAGILPAGLGEQRSSHADDAGPQNGKEDS